MLRFSTNDDISILKEIYNTCFPGESEFCNRYFEIIYPRNKCVVYEDGCIQGMAHLIDVEVKHEDKLYKGAYLYAVATLPDFRGRGIAALILKYIENHCKNNGYDFLCLIPQTPSLFDFYAKFGFEDALYISKFNFHIYNDTGDVSISSNTNYEQMVEIYNNCGCSKIKRDAKIFKMIERVYGSKFYSLAKGSKALAYCIGDCNNKTYEAYEAVGSKDDIMRLTNALAIKNDCKSVEITAPYDVYTNTVCGCIKPLTDATATAFENKKIYANLLFN